MIASFFQTQIETPVTPPPVLPSHDREALEHPSRYRSDPALVDAVNVALLLGQPLLLTGAPGTGKTRLAGALAWQLGLPLRRFDAKSESRARDVLYHYDALGHFRASQANAATSASTWLTWSPLGLAILAASDAEADRTLAGVDAATRSVVLIDEIDKAPRDFPNDLLAEVEELYFRVPELTNRKFSAPASRRPILVVTSNSERALPDAFLRRCVYHHITPPTRDRLRELLLLRLPTLAQGQDPFLDGVLDRFEALGSLHPPLRKPPSTAELIAWVLALRRAAPEGADPLGVPELVAGTAGVLAKSEEDLGRVRDALARS